MANVTPAASKVRWNDEAARRQLQNRLPQVESRIVCVSPRRTTGCRASEGLFVRHGSQIDPPNRFETVHHEPDYEHLEWDQEYLRERSERKIEYLSDSSKSIISENNSPDVPFRYSLNPYRGCIHSCSYCYRWSKLFEGRIPRGPAADLLRSSECYEQCRRFRPDECSHACPSTHGVASKCLRHDNHTVQQAAVTTHESDKREPLQNWLNGQT